MIDRDAFGRLFNQMPVAPRSVVWRSWHPNAQEILDAVLSIERCPPVATRFVMSNATLDCVKCAFASIAGARSEPSAPPIPHPTLMGVPIAIVDSMPFNAIRVERSDGSTETITLASGVTR